MKKYCLILLTLIYSFVFQSCWQISNNYQTNNYNYNEGELKNYDNDDSINYNFDLNNNDIPQLNNLDDNDLNIINNNADNNNIDINGEYTDKESVALYIHTFNKLPKNYITKKEAQKLGWDSKKGNLESVAPGKSIGGSSFGNYEGNLPKKSGRKYFECDIDYNGGHRNAKRIVYSNDGLVFYTQDHYNSFEKIY
ncbi:MAG: hypothetical protein MJ211_11250 [Bacteroidales bacterium]|nr:hypothetical protein [Bacteroidales bacterium]